MTTYNYFVNCAKGLPGFIAGQKEDVPYDITELANGYCAAVDAMDESRKSQYISALMVRYWHMVTQMYNKSQSTKLEFDDFVFWIYNALERAFKYRSWLDPNKPVSKDPKGAEKVINQCITTERQYWYSYYNKDKRKINILINDSLDEPCDKSCDGPESSVSVIDTVECPGEDPAGSEDVGRVVVQSYIDSGEYIKAIVMDGILYQDSFVEDSHTEQIGVDEEGNAIEATKYDSKFSQIKLVRHLKTLDDRFVEYFSSAYDVDAARVEDEVRLISSRCNATINVYVKKTMEDAKNNPLVRDLLC